MDIKQYEADQRTEDSFDDTGIKELNEKQHELRPVRLKPLHEQVIVITGASSGIGLVTARMAAEQGAKVVVAARNEQALQQLVRELHGKGHEAAYVKADVGSETDVTRIAETAINQFGSFDTWVNNAGVSIYGHALDTSVPDIERMFKTNFWGVVFGSREAVKHFKERDESGALINIGSLFGDHGTVVQSAYAASKFAVNGWTESIRMELDKENAPVSVTLVHPGRIDTPYNEHARSYMDEQPAHRGMIYPPEAVAEAILFAAANPKRDMYVGSQAKIFQLLGTLFPKLTDRIVKSYMYQTSHANRPSKPRGDSALYKAGYGLHERGTNVGVIRSGSLYVKAAKHPVLTAVALAGAGYLGWRALSKRDR